MHPLPSFAPPAACAPIHPDKRRVATQVVCGSLRFMLRIAVPLSAVALTASGCLPRPEDPEMMLGEPCVETYDQGCIEKSEFESLVEDLAVSFTEPTAFQNQWGLATIGLDEAYAHLELQFGSDTAPGEGMTIGLVDTGVDAAHPQFRNKNVILRFLFGSRGDDGSASSHGTAVASVIAGEDIPNDPNDAHGVAWGADLVSFAIPVGEPPEFYEPITLDELETTNDFTVGFMDAVTEWSYGGEHIDFLNLSVGFSGLIENYSEEDLRERFAPGLAALAQEDAEEKTILVWAASNSHGNACQLDIPECVDGIVEATSAGLLSGLALRIEEMRGHSIAVVAVGPEEGLITEFSNRCGAASEFCLAAPGQGIRVAYYGPGSDGTPVRSVATWAGTSFAAPMVTGGLALTSQYFRRQLSNEDVLARVLETADRSGPLCRRGDLRTGSHGSGRRNLSRRRNGCRAR